MPSRYSSNLAYIAAQAMEQLGSRNQARERALSISGRSFVCPPTPSGQSIAQSSPRRSVWCSRRLAGSKSRSPCVWKTRKSTTLAS